jgi:hypothetical protein
VLLQSTTTEIITRPLVVEEPEAFYISTRIAQGLESTSLKSVLQ